MHHGSTEHGKMRADMSSLAASIDKILASSADPLGVRASSASVVKYMEQVAIDIPKLTEFTTYLANRVNQKQPLTDAQFGDQSRSPQKIFLLDVLNFCFWNSQGKPRWMVEHPQGSIHNGWYALTRVFDRALQEGIPLLDPTFLTRLTENDLRHIFRSTNETVIPLLPERLAFLQMAGKILLSRFGGDANNIIVEARNDAGTIAQLVRREFSSFADEESYRGQPVIFLKRAQICAYDLSLLQGTHITNTRALTIFADYKIPQILRAFDVLRYSESLASQVDAEEILAKGTQEEVEIRAASIWACELLARSLNTEPARLDNVLWNLVHERLTPMKPYHRTLTTCY